MSYLQDQIHAARAYEIEKASIEKKLNQERANLIKVYDKDFAIMYNKFVMSTFEKLVKEFGESADKITCNIINSQQLLRHIDTLPPNTKDVLWIQINSTKALAVFVNHSEGDKATRMVDINFLTVLNGDIITSLFFLDKLDEKNLEEKIVGVYMSIAYPNFK